MITISKLLHYITELPFVCVHAHLRVFVCVCMCSAKSQDLPFRKFEYTTENSL